MDVTSIFESSLKTVRQRNNALPEPDKNRILPKKQRKFNDDFSIKTRDICKQITELRDLLLENRTAYMRFGCHLKAAAQMTDEQRNVIDEESEKIISICAQFIGELRAECWQRNVSAQNAEHMENILDLLQMYLRNVFKIYNEQKAYRVQYELDTYKMLKLESNRKLIPQIPARERVRFEYDAADASDSQSSSDYGEDEADRDGGHTDGERRYGAACDDDDQQSGYRAEKRQRMSREKANALDQDLASKFSLEPDEITAEDIQMFESENVQLYNELKGLSHEVEQIEKNVVDIAKLQDIFTEKVGHGNV